MPADCLIRPLREADLSTASAICRRAFATFMRVPDPQTFWTDREYVRTRWRADPDAALAAEVNGALVGSNFATRWGRFAFFGPLTVTPELWNQGIAHQLMTATIDLIDSWNVTAAGLFTFAHSPGHIHLYQKFGFWPRFLTGLLAKTAAEPATVSFTRLSQAEAGERNGMIDACRALTADIYAGLDVSAEIRSVDAQQLGDTVLLNSGDSLDAFAVCHLGTGTEAGAYTCYVKFAAVSPRAQAEHVFGQLLDACETLAVQQGMRRVEAGVNLNCGLAYRSMLRRGFTAESYGVSMHRPDAPAYNRHDTYVIDDLR
ncbi:GNAT family N-acetyltransferase [Mycobacterium kansasii]|uniref:GNAT family N-acetyltransferase n=1 Tax=Mycobacterium kansasii TaxID=1768 RepID=UPI000CDD33A7|nr:GNAT family N-acetyltransferase [Mycobacterium kansasii]POX87582.1 GNAT family N-acetyltransferase [Mycobacterium kansasii]POY04121.1 GNAT family N-acetyltransferase [Mycobacterium kansasii]POY07609.1 GNAT family N-acetyltransferase [Mycobacterium kansasii]POY17754.1 GNAT family N-acetyltransferase [Mycobacterium kansasii]POY26272.1 GNAT family N-acetyltransferase [Mycobacterium kansasii]